jgi:hypothetical protein
MANPIVYSNSANGQTEPVISALIGQDVEVTSSTQTPPTVTLDATLILGSLDITADNSATAIVNVVASVAGTLSLNADGGVIEASSTVGALTGVSVNIANGGTFTAESSFLSLLNSASITFAADFGKVQTLKLDNGGGLLNLSETSPLAGFQTGGEDAIDDNLIDGASVANYAITEAGPSQPDIVTYFDANGHSLGSLSFAAGTFNAGQLGSFAVDYVGGPLQLTVGSDGGIVTTTNGQVLDGASLSSALGAGSWITLDNTGGHWDTITGSQGNVYVTNAQGSIVGGGDKIYFDNSSSDAVSLYATNNNYDSVYGSGGVVILTNAQATVFGGGMTIYGNSVSDVSLAATNNQYDAFYGTNDTVVLTSAQAAVSGGNNTIYANAGSSASLFNTNNNWDTFRGSDDQVILTNAQVSVFGGGDTMFATAGSSVSLYNTAGDWDLFNGSQDTVILTSAQTSIVGGDNTVYAYAGSAISLYSTAGQADLVYGSNEALNLTSAQALLTGTGDTVYMAGQSTLSLSGNNFALNFAANIGQNVVNGFNATDVLKFSATDWTSFAALQSSGDLHDSNGNAVIQFDANNSVTLTGVKSASLTASEFKFA